MANLSDFILGFDFGTKRIGVAIGQTVLHTARPLCTIASTHGSKDFSKIQALIKEWRPKCLVVGVPLKIDGGELFTTHLARGFIKQLRKQFKLEVIAVDERLTTKAARADIFESQGYKGLQKADVDAMAAAIIIEHYLSSTQKGAR